MQERETRPKKIAFFGHIDSSNFGNENTLQAILYHLRRFHPDAEVACISTGPEATVRTRQIEAIPITERFVKSWFPPKSAGMDMPRRCRIVGVKPVRVSQE